MTNRTFNLVVMVLALAGFQAARALAADLPPVGDRRYVIDTDNKYAPVDIKRGRKIEEAKGAVLKDPLQPSKLGKVEHAAKARPITHVATKPVSKPGAKAAQLRFKRLPVVGHVTQPRVEFANDTVPLERADEPLYHDFFNKIFAPAEDTSF